MGQRREREWKSKLGNGKRGRSNGGSSIAGTTGCGCAADWALGRDTGLGERRERERERYCAKIVGNIRKGRSLYVPNPWYYGREKKSFSPSCAGCWLLAAALAPSFSSSVEVLPVLVPSLALTSQHDAPVSHL